MLDVINLLKIEYHGELVLTTKQLAEAYECPPTRIRDNFRKNKSRFTEGVHYFKLDGDELRDFKDYVNTEINSAKQEHGRAEKISVPSVSATNSVILWTHQGCVRHCKMINTEMAWAMFNLLENHYFAALDAPPSPDALTTREKIDILMKCAEITSLNRLRNPIIRKVLALVSTH